MFWFQSNFCNIKNSVLVSDSICKIQILRYNLFGFRLICLHVPHANIEGCAHVWYAHVQICPCMDMSMYRYAHYGYDMSMYRYAHVQVCPCMDMPMYGYAHAWI